MGNAGLDGHPTDRLKKAKVPTIRDVDHVGSSPTSYRPHLNLLDHELHLPTRYANAQHARTVPVMAPGTMTSHVCIESCWRVHVTCLEIERYCLEKGGMHVTT